MLMASSNRGLQRCQQSGRRAARRHLSTSPRQGSPLTVFQNKVAVPRASSIVLPSRCSASAYSTGSQPVSLISQRRRYCLPDYDETSSFQDVWSLKSAMISKIAAGDPQPRTLKDIIELGQAVHAGDSEALIANAAHVQQALSVRVARCVRSFNVLPDKVQRNEEVRLLAVQLVKSLDLLHAFSEEHGVVHSSQSEKNFNNLLRALSEGGILGSGDALAHIRGVVARARQMALVDPLFFDCWVSDILLNSVSWAVLVQHHIQLANHQRGMHQIGAFNTQLRPVGIARDCAFKIQSVCHQELGVAPRIEVDGDLFGTMEYIEPHYRYVLTEIMKNAAHATVKGYLDNGEGSSSSSSSGDRPTRRRSAPPPVKVTVRALEDEARVRISDFGGGMRKSVYQNIFRFGFTTAHDGGAAGGAGLNGREASHGSYLAGWGFGLPRSLIYTRYLGGNIEIHNEYGRGCDVDITIPKAASKKSAELLHNLEA
ncbi:[Pyruvate dehydrogenase (acetyl-transferring)] kinase [Diplonema papillatum]|nr:[Pyruvate dehydrogenase (acetyl-transferring)] kinase [Diplonema papillatum]